MKSHKWLKCIVWIVMSCWTMQSICGATDPVDDSALPDASIESGAYCGIYCVYATLHAHGKPIEFPTLLKMKYIGEMGGSSIQELTQAVTDNGLQALAMSGLSRANLVAAQSPIILHVSTPDSPGYFNHWILFLGMENGLAKIVDAPHKPELIPVADVLARWDGVGLYVSDQMPSASMLKIQAICTGENLALAAGLLVLVGLIRRASRLRRAAVNAVRPTWQMAGMILGVAVCLAAAWHTLAEDGYVRNQIAIRTVVQQHRPSFLPKLTIPELEKSLKDPGVVIIDARYPRDFESGHVPGAINVPVFTTQVERRKLLADLPKGARVIVYCQSENCQFDETLGAALYAEGIENVALFPGGIRLWEAKGRPMKHSSEAESAKTDTVTPDAAKSDDATINQETLPESNTP
jgi:rhodanese-related sulfurtransferase